MKYKSVFTGEYVAGHQYVAELIVSRKADFEKEILPFKYWNLKDNKWAKEYKHQVQQCGRLTKTYSIKAIINALNSFKWAFSLYNKNLIEEIKHQQKLYEADANRVKPEVNYDVEDKDIKRSYSKKGKFGKLL